MAREFDELESRDELRRRLSGDTYLPNLQEMFVRAAPPSRLQVQDPAVDTFRQRFAPFSSDPIGDWLEDNSRRGTPVSPGHRERYLDPTKVITEVPPSLNAPRMAQVPSPSATDAGTAQGLPPGFRFADELPPGFRFADEAPSQPAPVVPPSEDPFERAAARTQRGVQSPTKTGETVNEGIGTAVRAIGRGIYQGLDLTGRGAEAALEFAKKDLESLKENPPVAMTNRLGLKDGRFDPDTWVTNYGGLSGGSKARVFGASKRHLDAIAETGAGPLRALPPEAVARGLAQAGSAASLAQWAKAYERVQRVRNSGAIAAFNLATRNLNNNLGTELDPNALLRGSQDVLTLE